MAATRGKRKNRGPPRRRREQTPVEWNPITKLGKLVKRAPPAEFTPPSKVWIYPPLSPLA